MSDTNPIDFIVSHDEVELVVGLEYDLAPDLIGVSEDVFLGREDFIEGTAEDIGITDHAILAFTAINGYDTVTISDQTSWVLGPEYDYLPDLIGIVDSANVFSDSPSTANVLNDADAVYLGADLAARVYVGTHQVWP